MTCAISELKKFTLKGVIPVAKPESTSTLRVVLDFKVRFIKPAPFLGVRITLPGFQTFLLSLIIIVSLLYPGLLILILCLFRLGLIRISIGVFEYDCKVTLPIFIGGDMGLPSTVMWTLLGSVSKYTSIFLLRVIFLFWVNIKMPSRLISAIIEINIF